VKWINIENLWGNYTQVDIILIKNKGIWLEN
jgi:hypothetical protein